MRDEREFLHVRERKKEGEELLPLMGTCMRMREGVEERDDDGEGK